MKNLKLLSLTLVIPHFLGICPVHAGLSLPDDFRHQHWLMSNGERARVFLSGQAAEWYDYVEEWGDGINASEGSFGGVEAVYHGDERVYIIASGFPQSAIIGPWQAADRLPSAANLLCAIPIADTSKGADDGGAHGIYVEPLNQLRYSAVGVDGVPILNALQAANAATGWWRVDTIYDLRFKADRYMGVITPMGQGGQYAGYAFAMPSPATRQAALDMSMGWDTGTWGSNPPYSITVSNEIRGFTTGHSPLIGWSFDGLPIYGPVGYLDPDPNSESDAIGRMRIGYLLRDGKTLYGRDGKPLYDGTITTDDLLEKGRVSPPAWLMRFDPAVANAPAPPVSDEYPLGSLAGDYAYAGDIGLQYGVDFDLNEQGARWGRTPEFPDGTWAYFLHVNAMDQPQFPYAVGPTAVLPTTGAEINHWSASREIDEPVILVDQAGITTDLKLSARALNSIDIQLQWQARIGAQYTVEHSTDMLNWEPLVLPTGQWFYDEETGAYYEIEGEILTPMHVSLMNVTLKGAMGGQFPAEMGFYRVREVTTPPYSDAASYHSFLNVLNTQNWSTTPTNR